MDSRFKKRVATGVLVAAVMLGAGLAQAVGVPGQGTWETTLQPRDLDGNAVNGPEAFYDTALDITWLRDADVNGPMYRFDSDGPRYWSSPDAWANTLVVAGVGGWRLPIIVDTGAPGCDWNYSGTDCGYNVDTATGEMAHLYYVTLGNKPGYDTSSSWAQPGWGLTNTGGFQNLQSGDYWYGTEYPSNPDAAWYFGTEIGIQYGTYFHGAMYAMAVRPGDVAAVPEPQAYALMLMGVGVLVLALRRRPR